MKKVLMFAALLAVAGIASANMLTNGDFALGSGGTTDPDNAALAWSQYNSSGGWNNRETAGNPVAGDYLIAIGAAGGYGAFAWQDVAVADNGATYTLSADASLDKWWLNSGYLKIEFYDAGGTDPINMIGSAESAHFSQPGYDQGLPWANYSITGTAPAGTALVRVMLGTWGEGGTARFDNAVLVPEPITLVLLGLGGLALRLRK
ncbi:MAG: PEP-CTERM sorting domain-containing protein [Planctomycetaceae bacterium]|nr:PEP-CTERM sorting domain-containing protein [Planctomycetaceae bacterium]